MFRKPLPLFLKYRNVTRYCSQLNNTIIFPSTITVHRYKSNFYGQVTKYDTPDKTNDTVCKTERGSNQLPSDLSKGRSPDLLNSIKSLKHTDEFLEFIRNNSGMDVSLYGPIFTCLHQLQKSRNTRLSDHELCQTKEVEFFCQKVKKNVRFLKPADAISILKTLIFLGVSSNSILIQHLLQMLTKNVNQLVLREVIFLNFLLHKCSPSPLVDGLKIALPVIFENTLRIQLDDENPAAVTEAFILAFNSKNISKETLQALVDAALQLKDTFTCKQASTVINALHKKREILPHQATLYHTLMNIVATNMSDCLTFKEMNHLVYASLDMYVRADVSFYSEELISKAVDYVIEKKLDIVMSGSLLRNLNRVSYKCNKLIDYMDEEIYNMKNIEEEGKLTPFIAFLNACSNVSYKPRYWDLYQDKFVSFFEKNKTEHLPIVRITINFIIMKCWVTSLIEFCFTESNIRNFLKREDNKIDYLSILDLYLLVQTFYPGGYKKILPPADVIEKAITLSARNEFPLMGALAHGLGGYKFILNGVRTRLGHFLDYLIVKRKNGTVVVINENEDKGNSNKLVESLDLPADSFLLAIIFLSPASYCLDGKKIRGAKKLMLHTIEAMGISTIPVSQLGWSNLLDHDKVPYLLDKINTRTPVSLAESTETDALYAD